MIIIDGNYFARRFFHLVYSQKDVDSLDLFRHMFLENIINIKYKFSKKYGDIVIAKDSSSWRYDIFKDYKKSRKDKNKEQEVIDFFNVYEELLLLLKNNTNNMVIQNKNTEADDIIYILSRLNGNHLAYSGDKDIAQCVKENVDYYDFNSKTIIKMDKERIDYELLTHILIGDRSDDIHNITWNSETTKDFNDWIFKKHNIIMSNKVLYKMIVEESKIFDDYIVENNKTPYKKTKFGIKTAQKYIDSGNLETFINSNPILKRNYTINKYLIDLSLIPLETQTEVIEKYNKYEYKLPNINYLYQYCDVHKLTKVKDKLNYLIS